jgi:uncharacterized protein YneF (UPF0154 family)
MDRKHILYLGATAVVSLAIGFEAGYILTKKKLEREFDDRMDFELKRAREFYAQMYKKDEYASPEALVEKLIPKENNSDEEDNSDSEYAESDTEVEHLDRVLEGLQYKIDQEHTPYNQVTKSRIDSSNKLVSNVPTPRNTVAEPEAVLQNVFKRDNAYKPTLEERSKRSSTEPYLISEEEFLRNEDGHTQDTLTFFNGDFVLADSSDSKIDPDEVDKRIGNNNLRPLTEGKAQSVYVRNEYLEVDFEILWSEGKYSEIVLGFTTG